MKNTSQQWYIFHWGINRQVHTFVLKKQKPFFSIEIESPSLISSMVISLCTIGTTAEIETLFSTVRNLKILQDLS